MTMAELKPIRDTLAERAAADATRRAQAQMRHSDNSPQKLAWYVVQSVFGSDKHTIEWLNRFGYETYYPQMRETQAIPLRFQSQKQRRAMFKPTKVVDVPLFPRYAFVHFDVRNRAWHDQFKIAGASGMLCHGAVPAPITDAEIARLRGGEIEGSIPAATPVRFLLSPGTQVRILDGPFASFNGTVDRGIDMPIGELGVDQRIVVLANLFGRQTPVELEISQVAVE